MCDCGLPCRSSKGGPDPPWRKRILPPATAACSSLKSGNSMSSGTKLLVDGGGHDADAAIGFADQQEIVAHLDHLLDHARVVLAAEIAAGGLRLGHVGREILE